MSTQDTIDSKPPCKRCEEDRISEDFVENLLYSLFNPYYRELGKFDVSELIKKYMGESIETIFSLGLRELMDSFGFLSPQWAEKIEKYKEAKRKAWEELKKMIESGEIKLEDLSTSQLVDSFFEEVVDELQKLGYVEGVETRLHKKVVKFSKKAESILAEKVLELSIKNLEKRGFGETITEKEGISAFVGEKIVDFDDFVHSFDVIDIVESLLKSAIKGRIDLEEIVARQPKHITKCVYVMLIDVSDSMRGKKMIGAIEAALGLRKAIRKRNLDELRVLAFNHKTWEIKEGEILNLEPRGRTDIGLALRKAREVSKESDGTPVVLLISDGEPTSSYNPNLTPWKCSLLEAEKLRSINARFQIIMLGREGRFLELCKMMAKMSGNANLIHIADPLDLKKFVVLSYIRAGK
ncbi:MAG: VWA domain-containing protein [Archaeoglobaceae archaeon]|nr:VWA domain-containing protein [Archaeoglobaceae archaeon]MCX8152069.1 VWA domain-containing protein [Archaeoglobaceae archaeon]MDW8013834.1 VWA domain-containing protein [Archaeoglobaceae archaeon]